MIGLFLDVVVEFVVRVVLRMVRLFRSKSWPTVTGKVITSVYQKADTGCDVAEVHYNYQVDGEYYSGKYVNPFVSNMHGVDYVARFPPGTEIVLRVKPGKPSISVMDKRGSVSPAHASLQSD